MKICKWVFTLSLFIIGQSLLFSQGFVYIEDTTGIPRVELNDVVVNASKDNSKLKEMPASVSIVTGKEVELNEVTSLAGFDGMIPNLFMPDYGSKLTSPIYIRGIGSRINSPAVGLYVDHVPFFEKASHNFDFFDIESIEVLRGPQGTLYGRNTRGGIINITTRSPIDYQGTTMQVSAGTYGSYLANVSHFAKAGEKFAYSLAANYRHNDGFFTNAYSGKQADPMDSYSFRNRLVWKMTDHFTAENIAFYEKSDEGGYPYAIFNSQTGDVSQVSYDHPSIYNRQMFSDALVLNYQSGAFEIVSTTAFQYLKDLQDIDQDFSPDPIFVVQQNQVFSQIYQEFIMRSKGNSRLDWLAGASGFYQNVDRDVNVAYGDSGVVKYHLPNPYNYVKTYHETTKGAALFGQLKVADFMLPNLTFTVGLRVDAEEATQDYKYVRTAGTKTATVDDLSFKPLSSLELLPKFALNYQIFNYNVYAQISKGYKTGGYNSSFEHVDSASFKPEESTNYELGLKTALLDKQLYLDAALFYIDMKDQQIYQTLRSGRGSMLTNAGLSVSKGAEVTLKAIPMCGFETSVNYGYTMATFTEYVKDETTNYNGNYIPYAPQHTVAFNINKTFDIRNSNLLDRVRLNFLYRGAGDTYWNEDNKVKEGYYNVMDAKISFIRGNLQLDIFGKNIANEHYNSFYFAALGNEYVQTGKPRFMGVRLMVKL